jgi:hypothetical protein
MARPTIKAVEFGATPRDESGFGKDILGKI